MVENDVDHSRPSSSCIAGTSIEVTRRRRCKTRKQHALSIQTKATYVKHLLALMVHMGKPAHHSRLLLKTLIRRGAQVPGHQAKAITKDQLDHILPYMTPEMAVTVLIAFKTASRAGEVALLTRKDFIVLRPDCVVLYWGHKTKTTKSQPFRPARITTLTSIHITRFLQRHLGKGNTSHSLKQGAVHHLMEYVADNQISVEEVMRLANHRQLPSLLRYAGANERTARALGTQRVTRLL